MVDMKEIEAILEELKPTREDIKIKLVALGERSESTKRTLFFLWMRRNKEITSKDLAEFLGVRTAQALDTLKYFRNLGILSECARPDSKVKNFIVKDFELLDEVVKTLLKKRLKAP